MNLQDYLTCSAKKTAGKNSQYSRHETILKIDHFGKSIAMQNGQFGSEIFFPKIMRKMNLQEELSCFVQKTPPKNSQYSRNETILKIDHFGKTIAHGKLAVWVKKIFSEHYAENESTRIIKLFFSKNRWKKQPIFEN